MFPTTTNRIAIAQIDASARIRAINPKQVEALVASLNVTGLLHPISVCSSGEANNSHAPTSYRLVAGAHRLEACRRIGWDDIPAIIVELNEPQRIIAECDENLCGSQVSPAERALLTRERKLAYETLHPETRHGATGNGRKKSRHVGESNRFTLDTAISTQRSERAIQRDAQRGETICPDVLKSIVNTDLDTGVVLAELASTPREDQLTRLAELKSHALKAEGRRSNGPKHMTASDLFLEPPAEPPSNLSPASVWLVEQLGMGRSRLLLAKLALEAPSDFYSELRRLAAAPRSLGEATIQPVPPMALNVSRTLSQRVECRTEAHPQIEDAIVFSMLPGASDPTIGAECDQAGSSPILPADLGKDASPGLEPIIHLDLPASVGSTATEPKLRASNWRAAAGEPQLGDRCQECKSKNWFVSAMTDSRWYCESCFDSGEVRRNILRRIST